LYVFANARTQDGTATFTPEALGLTGNAYVYDWLADKGSRISGGVWTQHLDADPAYLVVVPVGRSGIAFLGDLGKFVPLGKKRVPELSDDGVLEVALEFAPGERSIIVQGWARETPVVAAEDGELGPIVFDDESGRFSVEVFSTTSNTARFRAYVPVNVGVRKRRD
jgi:hypothetical protein